MFEMSRRLLSEYRMASSFEFLWNKVEIPISKSIKKVFSLILNCLLQYPILLFSGNDPSKFNIHEMLSSAHSVRISNYGKSIVIPKRLKCAIFHNPAHPSKRKEPYQHFVFNYKVGTAFHLRNLVYESNINDWKAHLNGTFDIIHDFTGIDKQFQEKLDCNLELNKVRDVIKANFYKLFCV